MLALVISTSLTSSAAGVFEVCGTRHDLVEVPETSSARRRRRRRCHSAAADRPTSANLGSFQISPPATNSSMPSSSAASRSISTNRVPPLLRAIDLAVDAVEVADLIGIEVDPDRDSATAARQDRVDELVLFVLPRMPGMLRERGHGLVLRTIDCTSLDVSRPLQVRRFATMLISTWQGSILPTQKRLNRRPQRTQRGLMSPSDQSLRGAVDLIEQ